MQRSRVWWIPLLAGFLLSASGLMAQGALDSINARYQREMRARQAEAEQPMVTPEENIDHEADYSLDKAPTWKDDLFSPAAYATQRPPETNRKGSFNTGKLNEYRSKRQYQYDARAREGQQPSAWDAFWDKVFHSLFGGLTKNDLRTFWNWVVYGIIGVVVVFLFMAAFRMSPVSLFRRVPNKLDQETTAETTGDEELIRANFDDPIRQAVNEGNHRLAVRLLYLDALRTLARQGSIRWRRDKTNYEYLAELTSPDLRRAFADLTRRYEYSWYGEFPISPGEYGTLADEFARFKAVAQAERRVSA